MTCRFYDNLIRKLKLYLYLVIVFILYKMLIWLAILYVIKGAQTQDDYQLKDLVYPVQYNLSLLYDIDPITNFSFYGEVAIEIVVLSPTIYLVLHAQGYYINFQEITLGSQKGIPPRIIDAKVEPIRHTLSFTVNELLIPEETYFLTIPFFGNLLESSTEGIVLEDYLNDEEFVREYFIVTRFKPMYARRVFPCFDDPKYRARFKLILGHEKNYNSLSNSYMETVSPFNLLFKWPWYKVALTFKKEEKNFKWCVFNTTEELAPHLLSFVISKFKNRTPKSSTSHAKFHVWARPEVIERSQHALAAGLELLPHFENALNISYPLSKLDFVVVPNFKFGEISTFGLILFPESDILDEDLYSSVIGQTELTKLIAKTLSRQWFGNILSCYWWSEYWLMESLADLMANRVLAKLGLAWKNLIDLEEASNMVMMLEKDSLDSARPLAATIKDPDQIFKRYDETVIGKGNYLMRMLYLVFGDSTFFALINLYLQKHSYRPDPLFMFWDTLSNVSYVNLPVNVSVKTVVPCWITHTGYPLVTVDRNYAARSLNVTQARFVSSKKFTMFLPPTWWVPLRVTSQATDFTKKTALQWLAYNEGVSEPKKYAHSSSSDQWLLFNSDMIAPYRVNYDVRNWKLLIDVLRRSQFTQIPTVARVQLLSDAFELAWTGKLDYSIPLQMATYLRQETEYQPLYIGLHVLSKIENILKRSAEYGVFKQYVRSLITTTYNVVGGINAPATNDTKDLKRTQIRVLLSEWACRMDMVSCQDAAVAMFNTWMTSKNPDQINPIPLDVRRTVYCSAVSRGSNQHWQFLLDRKSRAKYASTVRSVEYALACTKELWMLSKFMATSISEGIAGNALDTETVISEVLESPAGYYVGKDILYRNYTNIQHLPEKKWEKIFTALLRQITSQKELHEFQIWREQYPSNLKNLADIIDDGVQRAQENIDWVANNLGNVVKLLKEHTLNIPETNISTPMVLLKSNTLNDENQDVVIEKEKVKEYKSDVTPIKPSFRIITVILFIVCIE